MRSSLRFCASCLSFAMTRRYAEVLPLMTCLEHLFAVWDGGACWGFSSLAANTLPADRHEAIHSASSIPIMPRALLGRCLHKAQPRSSSINLALEKQSPRCLTPNIVVGSMLRPRPARDGQSRPRLRDHEHHPCALDGIWGWAEWMARMHFPEVLARCESAVLGRFHAMVRDVAGDGGLNAELITSLNPGCIFTGPNQDLENAIGLGFQ